MNTYGARREADPTNKWKAQREGHARGEGPRAASRDVEDDRSQGRLIEAGRDRGRAGVDRHVPRPRPSLVTTARRS